jgi:hypothetical protein
MLKSFCNCLVTVNHKSCFVFDLFNPFAPIIKTKNKIVKQTYSLYLYKKSIP